GQECSAGGRVVKNVAGYDMGKLYTGSLGTLGIIAQVTLRVRPLPECREVLVSNPAVGDVVAALETIARSGLRPVILDMLNATANRRFNLLLGRQATSESDWTLVAGFDGSSAAVHWQIQKLKQELPSHDWQQIAGANATLLLSALTESPAVEGCNFSL